jgi:hypothetical protein
VWVSSRTLAVTLAGAATLVVTVAAAAFAGGTAGTGATEVAAMSAVAESPPSIEENYDYPGAAQVLAQRGIKLYKGDGHIVLVDCGPNPNTPPADLILVQSWDLNLPGGPNFCFKAKGTTGYLTMEISQAYFLRGENSRAISAKVETRDEPTVIDVERVDPGEWQPVGEGQSRGPATVLELRYPATA